MMQRLHGSVACLVNRLLPEPRPRFWRDRRGREFFDGCIRHERQARLAYRSTATQAYRHRLVPNPRTPYPHTRLWIACEPALARAAALDAFMRDRPYPRYARRQRL